MNTASIEVVNGLGDKMLDVIGFSLICKYMNYKPRVKINNETYWGSYSKELFIFSGIEISDEPTEYFVRQPHPSSSLAPFKLYEFIKKHNPSLTYESLCKEYNDFVKKTIQPSEYVKSRIPENLEKAYGIHLRKSDKVSNDVLNQRHMTTSKEFDNMINTMLDDIKKIVLTEDNPKFFVCSEDKKWANEIKGKICCFANKPLTFITPDYSNPNKYENFESVLDMFCLSHCKTIFQGVKYTTFSILASLLGNNRLMNYSYVNESDNECLIHSWVSTLEINNSYKNYDTEYFFCKLFKSPHSDITTNISNVYSSGL